MGWMGPACNDPCIHGTANADGTFCNCTKTCYHGLGCNIECSGNGVCNADGSGECYCDPLVGWDGTYCEIPGCPRNPDTDVECSQRGNCDSETRTCECDSGWQGLACHIPDCPGDPDCYGRGTCDESTSPPLCVSCDADWMGPACNDPCLHGTQTPMDSGVCLCESGWAGVGCNSECSEHGNISSTTNLCVCTYELGWKGEVCDIPGCPGLNNMDCSGRGGCDSSSATCTCNKGWQNIGCEDADCPGDPDCNDRGTCVDTLDPPECFCQQGWFGDGCEEECVNGLVSPVGSDDCVCDPGWVGINCDVECSHHGSIVNNSCNCDVGWRGEVCDIPGCPGVNEDCTGHGDCNTELHECTCYNGWTGVTDSEGKVDPLLNACDMADCPGSPDCNGQGTCDDSYTTPKCVDCNPGWMGPGCEDICDADHGEQSPMNSGNCFCDGCFTGRGCNLECDGHGKCVNGTCECKVGWRGTKCEVPGCPGNGTDCTQHGVCNTALQECTCTPGWTGDDCATPDCGDGACYGWFGLDCDKQCENGTVVLNNNLGGECQCDPCFNGDRCHLECSENGVCGSNSTCECFRQPHNAWVGSLCETEGCPGDDGKCNGNGDCINMVCHCYPGWKSDNCSVPECPNDCFDRGECVYDIEVESGVCICNEDWIGPDCSVPCVNGTNSGDGVCVCSRTCYTGLSCDGICNGYGICDEQNNGTCQCDFDLGYKGDQCTVDGCPGWPDNCMNHGTCNAASGACTCEQGWKGNACHIPDCDCNGVNATCEMRDGDDQPRCYDCDHPYIGDKCQYRCVHGHENNATFECICDECYSGAECDSLCNNEGSCVNGSCDCGFNGYRGEFCQTSECPGYDVSCTNHGQCNPGTGNCSCSTGWVGIGCHIVQCENDCSSHGVCLELDPPETPRCNCTNKYFGIDCSSLCDHGNVIKPDETDLSTWYCECDGCYTGAQCDIECSGRGSCDADGQCDCGTAGWRGDNCEKAGCPGLDGVDCSGHGNCITGSAEAIGTCTCDTYWVGEGCWTAECLNNCTGQGTCNDTTDVPFCTHCDQGWMGADCSTPCYGIQEPMDSGTGYTSNCSSPEDNCQAVCSSVGTCDTDSDSCICHDGTGLNVQGFWGDLCETEDCPGEGEPCSGHGLCIQGSCQCDIGWTINTTFCNVPDCPGNPDCSGQGMCDTSGAIPVCACYQGYIGNECEYRCINGTATADHECVCDPCFTGGACDEVCTGQGTCNNGTCACSASFWGEYCEERGCPGVGESCSGHGLCNQVDQVCQCDSYWTGEDCSTWDCPGDPDDCSNKGECDGDTYWPPKCVNCMLSMGDSCQYDCINGTELVPFSTECTCDACFTGFSCDVQCSNVGSCIADVNGTKGCNCSGGYKGEFCEQLDCPGEPDCTSDLQGTCTRENGASVCLCNGGFDGADCSEYVCPGSAAGTPCNFNGDCLLQEGASAPACVCYHGFTGLACDQCTANFVGTQCERCQDFYIGYNTTCDTLCVNGYATVYGGDVCECHDDDVNGHWINPQDGCVVCLQGWNLPHCTECAAHWVGPDCDISCIDYQGYFVDDDDGTVISAAVTPVFQCLQDLGAGLYTAWFGYESDNPNNVYISSMGENAFYSGASIDTTFVPPTKFIPQTVEYAVSIGPINMTNITDYSWKVYTLSVTDVPVIAVVDTSNICSSEPTLTELPVVQGTCSCNHGYWGPACENECPGGGDDPCFGKGTCDKGTGVCTCNQGANQTVNCETCISGWFGDDCSLVSTNRQDSTSEWYTGMAYGFGSFQTYDGSKYESNKVGQFLLTRVTTASSHQMDVHVVRSSGSNLAPVSMTSALGIRINGNTLVIRADDHGGAGTVTLNNEDATIGNGLNLASEVDIVTTSPSTYKLVASSDLFINIDMKKSYIDIFVSAKQSVCSSAEALLSSCDNDVMNDYVTSTGTTLVSGGNIYPLTKENIEEVFVPSWRTDDDVFTNVIPEFDNEGGDTCLEVHASIMECAKVWKTAEANDDIISRAFVYIMESDEPNLSYIWRFNDGNGYTTTESSPAKIPFNWEDGNWANIKWTVCTYKMDYPSATEAIEDIIDDPPPENKDYCSEIINTFPNIDELGEAAKYKYYEECVFITTITNDTDSGDIVLVNTEPLIAGVIAFTGIMALAVQILAHTREVRYVEVALATRSLESAHVLLRNLTLHLVVKHVQVDI
ncbi:TENX-like protein [Mya arenaria]|uniref:TENX-like protein n=1 Tax=Mya arenaria TaxID=6604 RepID=A0ABY7FVN5_MYAAR|nr:TENX-like protein [Mya arenaria]